MITSNITSDLFCHIYYSFISLPFLSLMIACGIPFCVYNTGCLSSTLSLVTKISARFLFSLILLFWLQAKVTRDRLQGFPWVIIESFYISIQLPSSSLVFFFFFWFALQTNQSNHRYTQNTCHCLFLWNN